MTAHFLAIYRPPRPTFGTDATEEEQRVIGEHFQYLKRLMAEGKLLIAGPCEDASMGLAVFEARDEAEAKTLHRTPNPASLDPSRIDPHTPNPRTE